jgi:hypothetical protein
MPDQEVKGGYANITQNRPTDIFLYTAQTSLSRLLPIAL